MRIFKIQYIKSEKKKIYLYLGYLGGGGRERGKNYFSQKNILPLTQKKSSFDIDYENVQKILKKLGPNFVKKQLHFKKTGYCIRFI